jgi:putative oxygen-independent coproporphyrinogen III oxidase
VGGVFYRMMPTQPFSIYIHVPFCRQACSYCDFYFVTRQQLIPDYVQALITQTQRQLPEFVAALPGARLQSIYFGGGTPSRLPAHSIARILAAIDAIIPIADAREITLEANPDDVQVNFLAEVRDAGVNRLSMGVQTFDASLLKFMNRAHSAEDALRCLADVQRAGFDRYSVDLIYGNPGQSEAMLRRDLDTLLAFTPPHVSAYALTIEPGTRLGKAQALGRLAESDDTVVARHMDIVAETLSAAGIHRYEVSNFARAGHEAIHNSSYWEHVPYLGLGPGAHSLLLSHEPYTGVQDYPKTPPPDDSDPDPHRPHPTAEEFPKSQQSRILAGYRWDNPADLKHYIATWSVSGKTPEATPEATPDATPEATPDATPDATPEVTPEVTPEGGQFSRTLPGGSPSGESSADHPQAEFHTHIREQSPYGHHPKRITDAAESLTKLQLAEERLLMALRTRKGIAPQDLEYEYGYVLNTAQKERIDTLRRQGLILTGDPLRLTPAGLRTADAIILDLVARQ